MGQIINNTIKVYVTGNTKKLDFILKYAYNKGMDIKCVGAGIGDRGGNYILFVANESLFSCLDEWARRTKLEKTIP